MANLFKGPGAKDNTTKSDEPVAHEQTINEMVEETANGILQLGQTFCLMLGQFADAGTISLHGESLSKGLAETAKVNEQKFAPAIKVLNETGPYAALIGAVLPFGIQILVNHGVLKYDRFAGGNIMAPATIEAKMKAEVAKMQMVAEQERLAAEKELNEMSLLMDQSRQAAAGAQTQNGEAPREERATIFNG